EIESAKKRLVQGRQHCADHYQANEKFVVPLEVGVTQPFPGNSLDQSWRKFQCKYSRVQHYAPGYFEQDRVPVPHDDRMPDSPRQAEFVHHADTDCQITKK